MQKIYSNARNFIYAIMAQLTANFGFTTKETAWKVTTVEDDLVIFEIHNKIKKMLEKETLESKDGEIVFREKSEDIWEAHVRANGVESYFFARMLFAALARIKSGTVDIESLNLNIIERHTRFATSKTTGIDSGFIVKIEKVKGIYQMTVPVGGISLTFSDKNVDELCRGIGMQLRGRLNFGN